MTIQYVLATAADAQQVARRLRASDRRELELSLGGDPEAAVVESVRRSVIAWAARVDGQAIAVFGAAPYPAPGVGVVWMLATDSVADYAKEFILAGRYYMGMMARIYPKLVNAVYAKNSASRKWLRKLGFDETRELNEYGVGKAPFVLVQYEPKGP